MKQLLFLSETIGILCGFCRIPIPSPKNTGTIVHSVPHMLWPTQWFLVCDSLKSGSDWSTGTYKGLVVPSSPVAIRYTHGKLGISLDIQWLLPGTFPLLVMPVFQPQIDL